MPRPRPLALFRFSPVAQFYLPAIGIALMLFASLGLSSAQARNSRSPNGGHCQQPLTELMPPLLEALPSYTNRVMQRSQIGGVPLRTYILIAGNADFEPLALAQQQWQTAVPDTTKQVFFTTLERSYTDQRAIASQNFYWAFFVQTEQGWQLALLYQQLGGSSTDQPTSPRRDASTGAIAQGIRLWLRDCQAGVFASS
ncbi:MULTISPECIES: hypothetical protein [unclassified Synechocystis]|uniref:hypothetical protein n=1 Tax=unclassified Synechocystis TaxID=2640012 RepID=UPI00041A12E6|nr:MULTISPECIES: hypothetical protein [unclassified Synechocystis]AIE74949.1 hypothetical protein D082_24210 [Synechocystis sp. PCC 6714]MCT0253340.1 hypothetical protein [Synechocystis sp. CS-94]